MTRRRENNDARESRDFGKISGVTYVTNPSGTTIYKGVVSTTTVVADGLKNTTGTGYTLPYLAGTGLKFATGVVNVPVASGKTKAEAAFFGLTAITFCMGKVAAFNGATGSTAQLTKVTTSKTSLFPAAGVSRVFFRVYNAAGDLSKKDVSVAYFAIGT